MRKEEWMKLVFILFLFTISFGFLIMAFPKLPILGGTSDGWLGYWGGIIGSILGIVGAILVFSKQIEVEKERARVQNVDNTFFNLLTLHNEVKEKAEKNIDYLEDLTISINSAMGDWISCQKKNRRIQLFKANKEIIIEEFTKEISNFKTNMEIDFVLKDEQSLFLKELERIKNNDFEIVIKIFLKDPNEKNTLREQYNNIDWKRIKEIKLTSCGAKEFFSDEYEEYENFINASAISNLNKFILKNEKLSELRKNLIEISELNDVDTVDGKREVMNIAFNKNYHKYGNYFRMFHRVIKYINQNVFEDEVKRNYIGFLRAMLDEKEMIVIFYNAFYTDRGNGLAQQLMYTNLFGDKKDFEANSGFTQHFNKDLLYWVDDDLNFMESCKLKICPRE